ncbi:MAG: DinB family protein [Bacteroidota bacterium]
MSNLEFFKNCWLNELAATTNIIKATPNDNLGYKPHPVNRSAKEIIEHLVGHSFDLVTIASSNSCDETLVYDFNSVEIAADVYTKKSGELMDVLNLLTEEQWENEEVELTINGASFITLKRSQMMWFFFFDIIHHRGQLSAYVRPMGGKNPIVYGHSADA